MGKNIKTIAKKTTTKQNKVYHIRLKLYMINKNLYQYTFFTFFGKKHLKNWNLGLLETIITISLSKPKLIQYLIFKMLSKIVLF